MYKHSNKSSTSFTRNKQLQAPPILRGALILCASLMPLAASARLGEDATNSVARYGKPTFELAQSNLTYRTHQFKGREIEVFLLDGISVGEFVNFKPRPVYSREDAAKVIAETRTLVDGILTSGYAVPQDELDALWQSLAPVSREKTEEADVTNSRAMRRIGEVDVVLLLDESHAEDFAQTITFEGYLSLRSVMDESAALGTRMQEILNAAYAQKQAKTQNAAAEGF